MAHVVIEMFTWRDCARCNHIPEDHHLDLPHYGCDCTAIEYRPSAQLSMHLMLEGRSVRYHEQML